MQFPIKGGVTDLICCFVFSFFLLQNEKLHLGHPTAAGGQNRVEPPNSLNDLENKHCSLGE